MTSTGIASASDPQGSEPRPSWTGSGPTAPRAAPMSSILDSKVGRVRNAPAITGRSRRRERGWPANFPVAQAPNAPLSIALGGLLVSVVADGSVHAYARGLFYAALAAWAWQELVDGVNWVRRAIGAAGLVYVVVRVGAALGR